MKIFLIFFLQAMTISGPLTVDAPVAVVGVQGGAEQTSDATWQATWTAAFGNVTPYDQAAPDAAGEAFRVWTPDRSTR